MYACVHAGRCTYKLKARRSSVVVVFRNWVFATELNKVSVVQKSLCLLHIPVMVI